MGVLLEQVEGQVEGQGRKVVSEMDGRQSPEHKQEA